MHPIPIALVAGLSHFANWLASASFLRYAIAFLTGLLVSLALTPVVREILRHYGMEDQPGGRRINKRPLTRGGGIAVFIAFHAAVFSTVWLTGEFSRLFGHQWRLEFLLASGLLLLIGIADDHHGLPPAVKLAGQIVVSYLLYRFGIRFSKFLPFDVPAWLDLLMSLFWFTGAMNAMNLIDGMDGLASGLALIGSLGIAGSLFLRGWASAPKAIPYLALAGACLGFLRYNFHPASVILGDSGSMFLGLVLATLPLQTASRNEFVASMCIPLMALGVPIFDTFLAIWRRSVRAVLPETVGSGLKSVMLPDKSHLHHRVLRAVLDQRRAAWILYGINALLVCIGIFAMLAHAHASGIFMIAFVVAIFVAVHHLSSVELWDSGRVFARIQPSRITRRIRLFALMAWDLASLVGAWMLACVLTGIHVSFVLAGTSMIYCIMPSFIAIAAVKGYRRVWHGASLLGFALLYVALLISPVVSFGLHMLLMRNAPEFGMCIFIYALVSAIPVCGIRMLRPVYRDVQTVLEHNRLLSQPDAIRALACGGGLRFGQLVRERQCRLGNSRVTIVGVLDDDPNLRNRVVLGHCVLGTIDDLPILVHDNRINMILVSADLPRARRDFILATGKTFGVTVVDWNLGMRMLNGIQSL